MTIYYSSKYRNIIMDTSRHSNRYVWTKLSFMIDSYDYYYPMFINLLLLSSFSQIKR